jgi:tRNA(fMet)-specific endonuclease VapC
MLDTDTVSYAMRGQGQVSSNIIRYRPSQLCVSAITVAELRFGASKRNSTKLHRMIDEFTSDVAIAPFDGSCAAQFGRIASQLAARGTPIGDLDVLIAAHASALGITLVTNNLRHFGRVRGLTVENWF